MNELERLSTLRTFERVLVPSDPAFDRFTRQAARAFRTPLAFISIVDIQQQWFLSSRGVHLPPFDRAFSIDAHVMLDPDTIFVVEDALQDARFKRHPMVTGEPSIRFYATCAIRVGKGKQAIGTLSIADGQPRPLRIRDARLLQSLSDHIGRYLTARMEDATGEGSARSVAASG